MAWLVLVRDDMDSRGGAAAEGGVSGPSLGRGGTRRGLSQL